VLFPEAAYTKLDLARYDLAVADGALPWRPAAAGVHFGSSTTMADRPSGTSRFILPRSGVTFGPFPLAAFRKSGYLERITEERRHRSSSTSTSSYA